MIRKKWAAVVLSLCLLLNVFPVSAANAADSERASVIQLMGVLGIMSGYPDGSFGGYDTLTRGQFAKILTAASTYKSLVSTTEKTSPFKDVTYSHWSAPYVKVAAQKKLLYGYPDGTYRPDEYVKTEEAVTAVLRMLGYADSDFGTSWPSGQLNTAQTIGLLDGVGAVVGYPINRYDTMSLIYNLLNTEEKSSGKLYAETLGYSVSGGAIDMAAAIGQNMAGPVTVTGDWYLSLGLVPSSMTVYRDGVRAAFSDIGQYDVAYYSRQGNTVWCYSNKISGTLEQILPNQDAPTSIVVAGNTYSLEGIGAYGKVAAGGAFKPGDTVTVLLGREKKAADVVASTVAVGTKNLYGYLTAAGQKDFTDSSGRSYVSNYAGVTTPDGSYLEYETDVAYSALVGYVVKVSTSNGKTALSRAAASASGTFDWADRKLGDYALSQDIKIMDLAPYEYGRAGKYKILYPQRIDKLAIDSSKVAFFTTNERNEIKELYLNNLTNDMYEFGIIGDESHSTDSDGLTTYRYTVKTKNSQYSHTTTNPTGFSRNSPVLVDAEGTSIKKLTGLTPVSGSITALYDTYLSTTAKNYLLASDLLVYREFNREMTPVGLSSIQEELDNYDIYAYMDKEPEAGGRVRVILVIEKDTGE